MLVRELFTRLSFKTDARGADVYDRRLDETKRRASSTALAIGGAFAGIGAMVGATVAAAAMQVAAAVGALPLTIAQAGDKMTASLSAINNVLENTPETERVYEKLYQAVRITGAGLEDSAKSFAKWHLTLADVGKSTDDTVDLVTGLQAAMSSAGASGSTVNSVIEQLGDALSSRKLSGDEFKSLKESLPDFIKFLTQKLGKSAEELEKLADDQKLSLDKWLDPLMEFAKRGSGKLAASPLTMARAWAGLSTTLSRVMADLDKAFGLSAALARGIKSVADALERWRQYIPMIAGMVPSFDRITSSLIALAAIAAVVFAPQIVVAARALAAAVWMIARGVLAALAPLAAVVMWFLIIEDFVSWMQGKRSLFGDKFGDFKTLTEPLVAAFEEAKARIAPVWEAIAAAALPILEGLRAGFVAVFEAVRDNWPALLEKMTALLDGVRAIAELVRSVLISAFEAVTGAIGSMLTAAQGALGWIGSQLDRLRGNIEQQRGAAPLGDPGGGLGLGIVPQAVTPGAAIGPAGASTTSQSNSIQNNVTVNATGASGAEVAAGARSGVAQAARDMISDLGGAARALSMSNPRAETAAA